MGKGENIWARVDASLVVVPYVSLDELKKYREAIRDGGLNVNNCVLLAVVDSKKERLILENNSIATFISEQDFNFLGQLKNENAQKISDRKYDLLIVVEDVPKKVGKLLNKTVKRFGVSLNSTNADQNVNLETVEKSPEHLINFARQTLEKII